MSVTVSVLAERPPGMRSVPLLVEPELGHYPEFARFFAERFGLDDDPFGPPAVVAVDGRPYELTFLGRSGRPFPSGLELAALVVDLEPLDVETADRDLYTLVCWILDGVGPPWSAEAFARTAGIFRIPARPVD